MEFEAAIDRIASLLRAGGVLAVLGLARSSTVRDFAFDVAGIVDRFARRVAHAVPSTARSGDPAMPIVAPRMTYREVERAASHLLPGCAFRRLLGFRYLLTWTKP